MPVLQVEHLTTNYKTLRGWVQACDDVNFEVEKGEAMGLVGESGCGKTTVALSLLKLLPSAGRIRKGRILFNGNDLVKMSDSQIRKIRWKGIAIIFQGAMNALNPVFKISDQITEAIKIHEPHVSRTQSRERVEALLEMVGIDKTRANNYPHEFSGGMRQRALIAMALAANPEVLVADEPGTALDVIVQAQILKLLRELKDKLNLSMVFISHDLSIVAETCEKLAIMYAGQVVEYGDTKSVFAKPLHPYTQGLLGAFPSIKGERKKLVSIPGQPPDLLMPPTGCRFNPRCPYVMDVCKKVDPKILPVDQSNHLARCHLYPQE
ncbi:MAG: dipeptide/oligopeptide/nickel ABC transporter ATP-binding protein [Crenarchaeota archaeon 13_1_20CM_2_51_8]|nr:MAG: dipeptide/oligopeptide/nickel ABC transporter ATP-binding protein [Crenarchaeota archaeon 13_1_40CM_3_53_5]OLE88782.1 MAG: dipeptide/oligopeptide/nickel ABC transporter ATP-binding protein [Crenarchaeota archaeon 13_1_20CM_2_51_8]